MIRFGGAFRVCAAGVVAGVAALSAPQGAPAREADLGDALDEVAERVVGFLNEEADTSGKRLDVVFRPALAKLPMLEEKVYCEALSRGLGDALMAEVLDKQNFARTNHFAARIGSPVQVIPPEVTMTWEYGGGEALTLNVTVVLPGDRLEHVKGSVGVETLSRERQRCLYAFEEAPETITTTEEGIFYGKPSLAMGENVLGSYEAGKKLKVLGRIRAPGVREAPWSVVAVKLDGQWTNAFVYGLAEREAREKAEREAREQAEDFAARLGRPLRVDWKDVRTGWTDLHFAALLNLPAVVEALIETGAAPDARLKGGEVPFGDGLKRRLAGLHPGVDWSDWWAYGQTPLMIAALADSRAAAAALVARGADVHAKNDAGKTPLHYAAQGNARETAEWLVARSADIHAKSNSGWTPLHSAAAGNARETAEWLVGLGADVHAKSNNGSTPLHSAAEGNARETAEWLVGLGADIHARNDYGSTPLHAAAAGNARETAEWLVGLGADIHARNDYGSTPLHYAAWENARETAEWLVGLGADVHAKSNSGWTPLHSAARGNARETAEWLVGLGADVHAQSNGGATPLDIAIRSESKAVQAVLRRHGGRCNTEC